MIRSEQIKAARALLGWSAQTLALNSKVGLTTIRRYEMSPGVPKANLERLMAIKTALEAHGIEFTGDPARNPGVVLNLNSGNG